jgi:hypothetical protein
MVSDLLTAWRAQLAVRKKSMTKAISKVVSIAQQSIFACIFTVAVDFLRARGMNPSRACD